ncbi:MAG TPA: hypothetical protein VFQ61_37675 [Polyangiaceae bacterium]|nr:hypothetical protein [Polyangiaceae bacterium]
MTTTPSSTSPGAMLEAIARADQLNLNPGMPGIDPYGDSLRAIREAPGVEDELERIATEGTPTGRVWAVMLLRDLAPERATPHLRRMLTDDSPIEVNTCLVGFRRTCDWARNQMAPRVRAAGRPSRPPSFIGRYALFLILGGCIAFMWIAHVALHWF